MRYTRHANLIAFGASLLLHGSALYVGREIAQRVSAVPPALPDEWRESRSPVYVERAPEAPTPAPSLEAEEPEPLQPAEAMQPEPTPEPALEPPPLAIAPVPIMPVEILPPVVPIPRSDGFGQLTGSPDATSLHALDGDRPMQAREAERDQAPLVREDAAPVVKTEPENESPPPQETAAATPATPEPTPEAFAPAPAQEAPQLAMADPKTPGFAPPLEPRLQRAPEEPPERSSPPPIEQPSSAAAEQIAPRRAPSEPRPDRAVSDSDSDAFSTHGSTEFRPGRVSAAFGRRVKTVRPRLSLAAQYDLFGLPAPRVVLGVRVDESGSVREVRVKQTSGSKQVDEACVLAMYDWWFEPPRNAAGSPVAAELVWTISFRH